MGPRDHQAEERLQQIKDRVSVSDWNISQDGPAPYGPVALDDVRWLLAERRRLVGILRLFTEVKH